MAQQKNENQKTDEKLSTENESIDETIARAERALEDSDNMEEAYQKLTSGAESEPEVKEIKTEEPEKKETPESSAAPEDSGEDDEYDLPTSYRKETRELFAKLPKTYEPLKQEFAKRARAVEKDRQKFYSEYQSKTAFAQRLAGAINPYLDNFTARGITPEVAVARAAKLDTLINQDPVAAAKYVMQIANIKSLNLEANEIEMISQAANAKQPLTENKGLSQDEIRQLVQQEVSGFQKANSDYQTNFEIVKGLADKKTATGKSVYPDLHNDQFCESIKADVTALVQQGKPFEKALLAAYFANGGKVEQGAEASQQRQTSSQDSEKVRRLQLASSIRPANSSTNNIRLEDITIPDSIEDTFALAQKLLGG